MKRSERLLAAVFILVLLLGALDRLHLTWITWDYATDDLTIVWMAARDYAHGQIHEPFFYGQDYGVMLEALIAAPFIRLGAGPIAAVPVVMAILALLPYWSFAWLEYRLRNRAAAILFAAMPLLLPVEHGLQCTNLNGLAMLALYPWVATIRAAPLRSALIGATLALSAFINLNTLVLAAAFGTYFLLRNAKSKAQWLWCLLGTLPIILIAWWSMHFHADKPGHVVHTIFDWRMVFHASLIPEALANLDQHFAWLCPLWWPNGHVVLWMLGAVLLGLFLRGHRTAGWAIAAALFTILCSFGFAKIHDGTMSVLFPYSRMFLSVPLLLCWGIAQFGALGRRELAVAIAIAIATVFTSMLRFTRAFPAWQEAVAETKGVPIFLEKVPVLRAQCALLEHLARETSAQAIVVIRQPNTGTAFFLNTGCPICEPQLPPTYMPDGDRRSWRVEEESKVAKDRLLVVGGDTSLWRKAMHGPFQIKAVGAETLTAHLITDPGQPVDSLMVRLGFRTSR
ncbi:MAG: hypothetical protein JST38_17975 [Bacteroidetes bacterium]|nr:hypothetical protein [Bacteroidota bacterium]MBS1942759.1 hypothetical protein [Bacteroidota bacterium]